LTIPKFDPFAVVRENRELRDSEGNFYPGELMGRQLRDAEKILQAALLDVKAGSDPNGHSQMTADAALALMNAWVGLFSAPGNEAIKASEELQERERIHIMGSFLAGYQAAYLVDLTNNREFREEALTEFQALVRKHSTEHATRARTAPINARRQKIQDMWASGKFDSRDTCADQEWEALGFPSFRAAREALTNTPAPLRIRDSVPTETRKSGLKKIG